jgi:lipoyl-dependent peroxiredoxin
MEDDKMLTRKGYARWEGSLQDGKGTVRVESGLFEGPYSFSSRFENAAGTNPEELIGAAHAGCFSQALALILSKSGLRPQKIETTAEVTLEKVGQGFRITSILLRTEGVVPGATEEAFHRAASSAKTDCPVSQALTGVRISLEANLRK